jgi:hypothetical protein
MITSLSVDEDADGAARTLYRSLNLAALFGDFALSLALSFAALMLFTKPKRRS